METYCNYISVAGTTTSYGRLTYGGASGGNATNSDYCTKYVVFKNLSGVYGNWKPIIGNETDTYHCPTISMGADSNIRFTRLEIYSSVSCKDWHVVAVVSNNGIITAVGIPPIGALIIVEAYKIRES